MKPIIYILFIFLLGFISPCEANFRTQGGASGASDFLLIRETKGTTIDLYPLYDGSGNVTALADTLQAEYAYGPFGETLYARGPLNVRIAGGRNGFRARCKYNNGDTTLLPGEQRFPRCNWKAVFDS